MSWFGRLFSKKTASSPARADGWVNELTGLGILGQDKAASTTFDGADDVTPQEGERLWAFDDVGAKIVEKLPEEMLRAGYEVVVPDDEDAAADVQAWAEDMGVEEVFRHALKVERALGGCAIFPAINDGADDLAEPLDEEGIMEVGRLTVFDCRELQVESYYTDVLGEKFGQPEVYRLQPIAGGGFSQSLRVHETRLIVFPGIHTTRHLQASRAGAPGWGFSVFARVAKVLRDFNLSWGSATALLADFAQTLIKIDGLGQLISANKVSEIRGRLQEMMLQRSTIRAVLIDSKENFERQATPVTGMPDLLDRFMTRVGAAADMPVSIIFGDAPAGLNATGQSDRKTFQDSAAAAQRTKLDPRLCRLFKLVFLSKSGPTGGEEPEHWHVKYRPLESLTALEDATLRKTQAEIDQVYFNIGLSPEEIFASRFGRKGYSTETAVDFDARDKLDLGPKEPEPVVPVAPSESDESDESSAEPAREDADKKKRGNFALPIEPDSVGYVKSEHDATAERMAKFARGLSPRDYDKTVKKVIKKITER